MQCNIAQKCLRPPTVTENRELVELFVKTLDSAFQDALNSRLSIQGTLKVDMQGRSHIEDPYDLDHVVQKTIELVSGKTIARALKHMPVILSRNGKVDPVMGIKRFDHRTKVKARSERRNLQAASQLCTKQVGNGEINQIIESLLKVKVQRITKTYQIET